MHETVVISMKIRSINGNCTSLRIQVVGTFAFSLLLTTCLFLAGPLLANRFTQDLLHCPFHQIVSPKWIALTEKQKEA
jgi:hypothetical protein